MERPPRCAEERRALISLMAHRNGSGAALLAGALIAASLAASAIIPAAAQDFGDTPYVQTPQNVVDRMLEIAKIRRDDYVIDLGSGDGRMIITAAKRYGARGFGVDLDRRLVRLSNENARKAGVADRAVFYQRDLHATDVSPASVISIYLLPEVNLMIRGKLLATLKPGTRIVSHDYGMGQWPADFQTELDAPGKTVGIGQRSKIFYWMVPGNAAGRWRWRLDAGSGGGSEFELALQQNFQVIEGMLAVGGRSTRVESRLAGDGIAFKAALDGAEYEFSGRITNHAIDGTARVSRDGAARELKWSATRVEIGELRHAGLTVEQAVEEMR